MKHGKKYREALSQVDRLREYELGDGIAVVKNFPNAGFDETVECAVRLGVDPRHADQMVRSTVVLPHGTGRTVRVLVFAKGEHEKAAQEAGADYVGADDLAEKIKGGWTDFDVAVATPDMMKIVGRLGKILGPRGIMPSPKAGTVTFEVAKAVTEAKAGKIEFRVDRQAIVHVPVGKTSFDEAKINENIKAFMDAIMRAKPAAAKGTYVKNVTICKTMSPGVRIDRTELIQSLAR